MGNMIGVVSADGEIVALCAHVGDALHLANLYGKDAALRIGDYVVWVVGEPGPDDMAPIEEVSKRIAWLRDDGRLRDGQFTVQFGGVVIGRL